MKATEMNVNVSNENYPIYKINHDSNGNPRYVIHFLALGVELSDYGMIPGLTKYRAKWFSGGYVFSSYNVYEYVKYMIEKVAAFYEELEQKALLFAEKHGIIEYQVNGSKMTWYVYNNMENTRYKCVVNLHTMQETRSETSK